MKLIYLTLPFSALLAGVGVWMVAEASHGRVRDASPNSGRDPIHPVTASMTEAANKMASKDAPEFTLSDPSGKSWSLASLTNGKPLYMYFILDGCPCSTDAEPIFHQLYRQFKGAVNFVGIIGSDPKTAGRWASDHSMPYPILSDPTCKVIHAYKARSAVYNVLVTPDHKIDHLWPGYSQDLLKAMNRRIAQVAGVPEQPFDPLYAPLKKTTGCFFPIN